MLTAPYDGDTVSRLWEVELAVFTFLLTWDVSTLYEPGVYMWVYNHCAVQLANRVQSLQGLLASMVSLIPEYSAAFTQIIWPIDDDDARSLFAALRSAGPAFFDRVVRDAVPSACVWLRSDGPTATRLPFHLRSVWVLTEMKVRPLDGSRLLKGEKER